jgi:hypothetical protein
MPVTMAIAACVEEQIARDVLVFQHHLRDHVEHADAEAVDADAEAGARPREVRLEGRDALLRRLHLVSQRADVRDHELDQAAAGLLDLEAHPAHGALHVSPSVNELGPSPRSGS